MAIKGISVDIDAPKITQKAEETPVFNEIVEYEHDKDYREWEKAGPVQFFHPTIEEPTEESLVDKLISLFKVNDDK